MHIVLNPGNHLNVEIEGELITLDYGSEGRFIIRTDMPDNFNRCGVIYDAGGDCLLDGEDEESISADYPGRDASVNSTNASVNKTKASVYDAPDDRQVIWSTQKELIFNPITLLLTIFFGLFLAWGGVAYWLDLR